METKLTVTITLPGRVLLSEEEAKERGDEGYSTFRIEVIDYVNKKKKREVFQIKERNCREAKQTININNDSYYYMIKDSSRPTEIKKSVWSQMPKKERIEYFLDGLCKALGGTSYTYHVFND